MEKTKSAIQRTASSFDLADGDNWDMDVEKVVTKSVNVIPEEPPKEDEDKANGEKESWVVGEEGGEKSDADASDDEDDDTSKAKPAKKAPPPTPSKSASPKTARPKSPTPSASLAAATPAKATPTKGKIVLDVEKSEESDAEDEAPAKPAPKAKPVAAVAAADSKASSKAKASKKEEKKEESASADSGAEDADIDEPAPKPAKFSATKPSKPPRKESPSPPPPSSASKSKAKEQREESEERGRSKKRAEVSAEVSGDEDDYDKSPSPPKSKAKAGSKDKSAPSKKKESSKAQPTIADFPRSRMMFANHRYVREDQRFVRALEAFPDLRLAFDIVDDLTDPLTELIECTANYAKAKKYSTTEEIDLNRGALAPKDSDINKVTVACFKILKQHLGELKERAPALVKLGANLAAVTGHYLAKADATEYEKVNKDLVKAIERAAIDRYVGLLLVDSAGTQLKYSPTLDATLMDLAPTEAVDKVKEAVWSRRIPRMSDKKIVERCEDASVEPMVIDYNADESDEKTDGAALDPAKLGPLTIGKLLVANAEATFGKKMDALNRDLEKAKKLGPKVKLPPLTTEDLYLARRGLTKPPEVDTVEFTKASRARTLVLRHLVNVFLDWMKNSTNDDTAEEKEEKASSSSPKSRKEASSKGSDKKKPQQQRGALPSYLTEVGEDEDSSQDSDFDEARPDDSSDESGSDSDEGSMEVDDEEAKANAKDHKSLKTSGSRSGNERKKDRSSPSPSSSSKKRKRSGEDDGKDSDEDDEAPRPKSKKTKRTASDDE